MCTWGWPNPCEMIRCHWKDSARKIKTQNSISVMTTANLSTISNATSSLSLSPDPGICQCIWAARRPTAARNSIAPTAFPAASVRLRNSRPERRLRLRRQLLHLPPAFHGWESAADADGSCVGIGCYSCRLVTCCVDLWRQVTARRSSRRSNDELAMHRVRLGWEKVLNA